ncbi:transmembrane protein [Strigomonas culicis]|uniref:Transmembrane protein n=1 Tax=Strigomonas culicis TaxID=28005 RepID=S9UWA3_9TRYP|nr:transmembrane protein [Strigomonas culicis]|eukprot:EPY33148.1 transmembrane protein [Strigomonas culicis]
MYNAERTIGGASFPFQLMLVVSMGWSVVWLLLTFSFLIFKATVVPFPPAALPMEIIACFLVLVVQVVAALLGMRGNLTEDASTILISLLLLAIVAVGAIYYMWLQTYVMMLDLAFSAILLGCNGLTLLCGVWAAQRAVTRSKIPQYMSVASGSGMWGADKQRPSSVADTKKHK